MFWAYWSVAFATFITWIFAVAAAADDGWFEWGHLSLGTCLGSDSEELECGLCECYSYAMRPMKRFALLIVEVFCFDMTRF